MRQCKAIKADGTRCKQIIHDGGELCLWHDPERRAEAQGVRKLGGKRASKVVRDRRKTAREDQVPCGPPASAQEAQRFASWATWAVATGQIDTEVGAKVSGLIQTFLRALEKSELEEEVRSLRARLEEFERAK